MALKSVFAYLLFLWFANCEAKSHNELSCKLFAVGTELVDEFRRKALEKGVRVIYFNLVIGNGSYDPVDLADEFLPNRWVWAATVHEPMLTLPDDYDILSWGLLNNQVRSMDVPLADHPSGCLANLNSTTQNLAIGRMLFDNVTKVNPDELSYGKTPVVCVKVLESEHTDGIFGGTETVRIPIGYQCCGMQEEPYNRKILCDQRIMNLSSAVLDYVLQLLSFFVSLFFLAIPLALPDWVFSLQDECKKETIRSGGHSHIETLAAFQRDCSDNQSEHSNEIGLSINSNDVQGSCQQVEIQTNALDHTEDRYQETDEGSEIIPADDSSPITLSTLLRRWMQAVGLSFNIKLAIMFLCVYPCSLYIQIGLYNSLKKTYINESVKKSVPVLLVFKSKFVFATANDVPTLLSINVHLIFMLLLYLLTTMLAVLFLKPGDLILQEGLICYFCKCLSKGHNPCSDRRSLGDAMLHRLKMLSNCLWEFTFKFGNTVLLFDFSCPCREYHRQNSRRRLATRVLLRLLSVPLFLVLRILCVTICLPILIIVLCSTIIVFSPTVTFGVFVYKKSKLALKSRKWFLLNHLFPLYIVLFSTASNFFVFLYSCNFIMSTLGFFIMGLVLNVEIVTPYVAFFIVVTSNLYLCYSNMQKRYKEVKMMILKWQKELEINTCDPNNTIRTKIFWFVCERVLPLKSEMCRMFGNMTLVLAFLFLVVYSIAFFGREYNDVSAIVATIYVFFSGVIPALILRGGQRSSNMVGWKKVKMDREIEAALLEQ